jgi:hypothetical protein
MVFDKKIKFKLGFFRKTIFDSFEFHRKTVLFFDEKNFFYIFQKKASILVVASFS